MRSALTTAMCWGMLPIAMKHGPYYHGALHRGLVPFFNGRFGLLLLAPRGQLPPLRLFFRWRWLILLAVATAGLLGNFVFFSTSLQYLNPTASKVIGQLSPVGMMLASVVILKSACASRS